MPTCCPASKATCSLRNPNTSQARRPVPGTTSAQQERPRDGGYEQGKQQARHPVPGAASAQQERLRDGGYEQGKQQARRPVPGAASAQQERPRDGGYEREQRAPLLWLAGLAFAVLLLALFVGRYPAPYLTPPGLLWRDPLARRLVLHLRLPRVLAAALLGMTLSAGGLVMQMLFRNPLVEPGFLGVSQGAAFGAALSIVLGAGSLWGMQLSAALFGCLGLAFSYALARHIRYGGWTLRLILAGIAVSALFSSGVGLLKYVADPLTQLPDIVFWMLGALWGVTWRDVAMIAPVTLTALTLTLLLRWRLNLLSLDERTAFSLGAAPARERLALLVAVVAATASVVAISGVVGWVGLIVPHLARRILGADARHALPGALLLGATFTVICDTVARAALPGEIPLGILTSMVGALLFSVLMVSPRQAAWERAA